MTQVELPQLSLQRYVDLVRRRRWQLLPVSLLGLLVGGLIAFFIPRFFVATTLLVHQQLPGVSTQGERPFREIVDSAESTVPLAVGDAVDALGWPDVPTDPFGREQFLRDVESRISVRDANRGDKDRTYAQLSIEYRDRDGERAERFLNTLVEVWIERRTEELRKPAEAAARRATDKADRARRTWQGFNREKQALERRYGISPAFNVEVQRADYQAVKMAAQRRATELTEKRGELARAEVELRKLQQQLAGTEPRIKPQAALTLQRALEHPEAKKLVPALLAYQNQINTYYQPGTRIWRNAKRNYEMTMQTIELMLPPLEVDPDGKVANPKYEELFASVTEKDQARAALAAEIEKREQADEAAKERAARLVDGYGLYAEKLTHVKEAAQARDDAIAELKAAQATLSQLTRDRPVKQERKAVVPPAPTEPNILVVAMIGCVLGLGAAIGLILLLDVVQGTFKTVEDVERGLGVPVLGGVSYLETEGQRRRAIRSRRRASITAAAALLLVTTVVTIYYLDPTRLPTVVRDILTMLLGA